MELFKREKASVKTASRFTSLRFTMRTNMVSPDDHNVCDHKYDIDHAQI